MKRRIAIIPARGGSKGIKSKNIQPLCGVPLITWTIRAAIRAGTFHRIIVSTDSEEIAAHSREAGGEVPFLRPRSLAADGVLDYPVCKHALDYLATEEKYHPELMAWLRPTSPLRGAGEIREAITLFEENHADWLRSVCLCSEHPYWMYEKRNGLLEPFVKDIDLKDFLQRQKLPPLYYLNGAVDISTPEHIQKTRAMFEGTIIPYIMPAEKSLDIDSLLDLHIAEWYLKGVMEDHG